jgi:hypothetical protein
VFAVKPVCLCVGPLVVFVLDGKIVDFGVSTVALEVVVKLFSFSLLFWLLFVVAALYAALLARESFGRECEWRRERTTDSFAGPCLRDSAYRLLHPRLSENVPSRGMSATDLFPMMTSQRLSLFSSFTHLEKKGANEE